MAATMKHRRSARRRKTTRGADRYDKQLTRAKKVKKYGGSLVVRSHRVTKESPIYKGVKVLNSKGR